MSASRSPSLDLEPKRDAPLLAWSPWDYLVLIYWSIFFPQALRWYLGRFARPEYRDSKGSKGLESALENDPIQRNLVLQALVCILLGTAGAAAGSEALGVLLFNLVFGAIFGLTYGLERGVAFSVAFVMVFGAAYSVPHGSAYSVAFLIAFVVAVGSAFSAGGGIVFGITYALALSLTFIVTVITPFLLGVSISFGQATLGFALSFPSWQYFLIFCAVIAVAVRLFDWLLVRPLSPLHLSASHVIWFPLPLQRRLEASLERNWLTGVADLNSVLAYSLQFLPVVAAANATLARSPKDQLLVRAAALADRPFDWNLLRFCSASLSNQLRQSAIDGLYWLPQARKEKWKARYPVDLRLYAPQRSVCAGFWSWHQGEADQAAAAFYFIRDLPHGRELYGLADAIAAGGKVANLQDLADWREQVQWLEEIDEPALRPGSVQALRALERVASEAALATRTQAPAHRSAALGRANSELIRLEDIVPKLCPPPEGPLLAGLAEKWRHLVLQVTVKLSKSRPTAALLNPFEGYSGLPVSGRAFVGRREIFAQIETLWSTGDLLPALILYGHRRMGKTSILRNLEASTTPGSLFLYLDMQDSSWIDHTGQLLLDLAELLHRKAEKASIALGPPPNEESYSSLGRARKSLNVLMDRLDSHMEGGRRLILAIDEFELIEEGIAKGRIDKGLLSYLRALNQHYRWFALVFGGLHTLDELGRDYRSAFYGQAQHIRVGYLAHTEALRLITEPHPEFALQYSPKLCERLFDLTWGQPYLLQRLCWELVSRWQEQSLAKGEGAPKLLTLEHLRSIPTEGFYASADYYFDGVWSNVTPGERDLMLTMATRRAPWTATELRAEAVNEPAGLEETLMLLKRHDVVVEEDVGFRFASALMRRWVDQRQRPVGKKLRRDQIGMS